MTNQNQNQNQNQNPNLYLLIIKQNQHTNPVYLQDKLTPNQHSELATLIDKDPNQVPLYLKQKLSIHSKLKTVLKHTYSKEVVLTNNNITYSILI